MVENISDAVTTLAGYIALIEFIIKMIKALRRRVKIRPLSILPQRSYG